MYRYIEKKGAVAELKELGLEEGDIVRIKDYEFEYSEEYVCQNDNSAVNVRFPALF